LANKDIEIELRFPLLNIEQVAEFLNSKAKESDAIIVINVDKNGIKNYIGGNTFLEMGFAYVLDKKLFLLNDIPKVNYKDEIVALKPIILNGNIELINK